MNRLQTICHPLILKLCEVWMFSRCNAPIHPKEIRQAFMAYLREIRENVSTDPIIERDFKRIEQPLVFFVDYTMRKILLDTHSPEKWQDVAMEYNELAGDEKFFEMLTQTLDDPDTADLLVMYYLFMGLGFEGAQDRVYVERRMKVCAARLPQVEDLNSVSLSSDNIGQKIQFRPAQHKVQYLVWGGFAALVICFICALTVNHYHFYHNTAPYRNALMRVINKLDNKLYAEDDKTSNTSLSKENLK